MGMAQLMEQEVASVQILLLKVKFLKHIKNVFFFFATYNYNFTIVIILYYTTIVLSPLLYYFTFMFLLLLNFFYCILSEFISIYSFGSYTQTCRKYSNSHANRLTGTNHCLR